MVFDQSVLNSVDRHVGARIRTRRLLLQMPDEWLAGMLDVRVDELAAFEEGRARISFEQLGLAAELLEVPHRYFYMDFQLGPRSPHQRRRGWIREVDRWFSAHLFPHERSFLALARRLTGNAETAREMVQQTYVDLISGDKWRGAAHPKAYTMRAVYYTCVEYLRRSKVVQIELVANMETIEQVDLGPSAHDLLSAKEKRQRILDAIEALPPQCRKVVKLRRLNEMLPQQIAEDMGISLSTVKSHLSRGMELLAVSLSDLEESAPSSRETSAPHSAAGE